MRCGWRFAQTTTSRLVMGLMASGVGPSPAFATPEGAALRHASTTARHRGPRTSGRSQHQESHAQSRQAGRAAARASPLSHNLGPDSSASRFRSTQIERRFDPTAETARDGEDVEETRFTTPASAGASPSVSGLPEAAPVVAPYSALAYRARLRQGHIQSLVDLAHAPYAPRRLRVLLDVFGVLQSADKDVPMSAHAQHRLSVAVSRTSDVAVLLHEVVGEVVEVVAAAEELGDRDSAVELQEMMQEVEQFVSAVMEARPSPSRGGGGGDGDGDGDGRGWQLPEAVYAEALHGALEMTSHLSAHKTALIVLEELLALDEARRTAVDHAGATSSRARSQASHARDANAEEDEEAEAEEEEEEEEASFALDAVVAVVEEELAQRVRPVTAVDHLLTMESCAAGGEFHIALILYKRLVQHAQMGYVAVAVPHFERGLVALAHSVRNAVQFAELQELLLASEVAQSVPVTVNLYTALIDAVSRADENPERMSIALALYRRLRDGQLALNVKTYSALMACCASCKEPTHAFAFYHEARLLCGASALTPAIYTNLVLSYANAGFGADARRTLDVLVEAGAPLTRAAFHAALAGALTLREAQEVMQMMTDAYHIPPTPHTYAFLIQAAAKQPSGVTTALHVFDLHEEALHALSELVPALGSASTAAPRLPAGTPDVVALSTSTDSERLEGVLLDRYPHYVQALAHAVMKLRIDPHLDARLQPYLKPLVRLGQRHMNAFTGGMPPQAPTVVPPGSETCIAVLAPDVLAHIDDLVEPFMAHYTAVVIPYSALLALSIGGARRRVEGVSVRGVAAGLHDGVWQAAGSERGAVIQHRRQRLLRFLDQYRDAIHLVSLEEELAWSRDVARYGIGVKDWHARSAALAIQLARRDVRTGFRLYAEAESTIVLVSTDYNHCGRFVVDLKRSYGAAQPSHGLPTSSSPSFDGLRDGLSRVVFHNPRTQPQWTPRALSASHLRKAASTTEEEDAQEEERESSPRRQDASAVGTDSSVAPPGSPYVDAVSEEAAANLYRRLVHPTTGAKTHEAGHKKSAPVTAAAASGGRSGSEGGSSARRDDDLMDAELLLDLLNM